LFFGFLINSFSNNILKALKDSDDAFEMAVNASKEKQSRLEENAHLAELNVFDLREKRKVAGKDVSKNWNGLSEKFKSRI
jgi:hypothetical protein